MEQLKKTAEIIKQSKHLIAFTGAGISAESNIPTFRGKNGIWNKYNPKLLDITYFKNNSDLCWKHITDMFFSVIDKAYPNYAHYFLYELEQQNILKSIITQNIDNLHQKAGNKNIIEFHGNTRELICTKCKKKYNVKDFDLLKETPKCLCGSILKPDFVFFGENIPVDAYKKAINEINLCDVMLIIGTTGEIMPASILPYEAKNNGSLIIEINPEESNYTNKITDYFIKQKAVMASNKLKQFIL